MKKNLFIRQLGEYFETFLPDIYGASENTISAYAYAFALFFRFMQDTMNIPHHLIKYKDFTAASADKYILWMKNVHGHSNASIRQRISAIVSFLKYASRREMCALNAFSAFDGAEAPSAKRTAFPYFTLEETKILLSLPNPDAYLGKRDLVVLSFLYDTAARAEELCKTRVGDVRFGSPTKIKLNGKGSKTREIPISGEVASLLRFHMRCEKISSTKDKDAPLFLSQSNCEMTTACVRSIVGKYVKLAKSANATLFKEPRYSPHSFRHSKAVHMVEAGLDLIYIRNFLGHAFISSTEIYARVGQEAVARALMNRKIPRLSANEPLNACAENFMLPEFISDAM